LCFISLDGYASIDLATNSQCFKLRRPQRLSNTEKDESIVVTSSMLNAVGQTYDYAIIEQVFSVNTIPKLWSPLCAALLKWYRQLRTYPLEIPYYHHDFRANSYASSPIEEAKTTEIIQIYLEENSWSQPTSEDILMDKTMLEDAVMVALCDKEGLFRYIASKNIMEILFWADYSFAISNEEATEFVHYSDQDKDIPPIYTLESAPETQYTSLYQKRYAFASVFQKAYHLLRICRTAYEKSLLQTSSKIIYLPSSSIPFEDEPKSRDICEHVTIPEWGEFIAFHDGRIYVRFVDRIHLELSKQAGYAKLMLANGTFQEMDLKRPSDHNIYLHVGLKFATWAFATSEERTQWMMQDMKLHQSLQQAMKQSQQFLLSYPAPSITSNSSQQYNNDTDSSGSIIALKDDASSCPWQHSLSSLELSQATWPQFITELHERNSRFLVEVQELLFS
jgi:hypothetical protein